MPLYQWSRTGPHCGNYARSAMLFMKGTTPVSMELTMLTVPMPTSQLAPSPNCVSPARFTSTTATFAGERLASLLAAARSQRGLSMAEAADRSGLHKSVISRIETGVISSPRFDVLAKLAFVYGLSLDEIAGYLGLPRVRVTLDPPVELEIGDSRLRAALLALAQSTDPVWVNQTINAIAAIAAR